MNVLVRCRRKPSMVRTGVSELLEKMPESLSPDLSAEELRQIQDAATSPEDACRNSHKVGWSKGLAVGAVVVLVGIAAVVVLRTSKIA
jgi:hypothetical protein